MRATVASGIFSVRSQSAAKGAIWRAANSRNSSWRACWASVRKLCIALVSGGGRLFLLADDEARGGLDGFEVRDFEIIRADFDAKRLIEEGHQLDYEQRIHDAALEKVVVVREIGD